MNAAAGESPNEPDPPGVDRRDAHPPMPRDKRGWHVAPAPDGRGMPDQTPSGPPVHRRRGFLWFVLALLALNWLSLLFFQPSTSQPRVTIPFNPVFLQDVQAGQVKAISTKGDTVEGTFTTKLRYPPSDKKATPTTQFKTEIPSFWNGGELSALLRSKGVQINAKPTTSSPSLLAELLL